MRTPRDIEREVGLTEGNIFQGELTFDQLLFNRPVPGWARYRSPVHGLYLVGSSAHPGGGVIAAPGANAAREILRDLRGAARQSLRRARVQGGAMAFDRGSGRAAAVIGAGVNGLTTAAALARNEVAVTVLERAGAPGGMAAGAGGPVELAQFVRGPHAATLSELGLSRDDLRLTPVPTVALQPAGGTR